MIGISFLELNLATIAPRWDVEGWSSGLGWLYVASDFAIGSAFIGVLWIVAKILRLRGGSTFNRLFGLFAIFLFVAGASYLGAALVFWYPFFTLLGVVKLLTALAAWCTVIAMFRTIPDLVDLPSLRETNQRLSDEIQQRKATEKELTRAQSRYQALMDGTRVIVWTTDAEGKFVTPQVSWQLYTGQTWAEHQGFGWVAKLHEEDQVVIEELWGRAIASKSVYRAKGRLWHAASESYHPFVVEAVPVMDENDEILEWFGTVSDVT